MLTQFYYFVGSIKHNSRNFGGTNVCHYIEKPDKTNMFQENSENAFDIPQYKTLKRYLTMLGLHPYQDNRTSNIIIISIVTVYSTVCWPATIKLYNALQDKDYDDIIEDLPQILVGTASIIKLLNIRSNKTRFRKLFDSIVRGRKLLKTKEEFYTLDKLTEQGGKLAYMYRSSGIFYSSVSQSSISSPILNRVKFGIDRETMVGTLLVFLVLFLSLPLRNPLLDIILPLNETRPRQHIFKVRYIIIDEFEYFYTVYMHLSLVAIYVVLMIVVVDSLYITIIHHASGLFAVCGYQVQEATENDGNYVDYDKYGEFRRCITVHHEALQFYKILEHCCRNLYLIQMGINMLVISVTAVEVVLFLGRPGDAIRASTFLIAQQLHLYVVSLPGQVLLDESTGLANKIFASSWYKIPVKVQKLLHIMQIRSDRPCILTAAGLYEMKIESFGITVKTCMSYFMMFLSLRE